MKKLVLGVFMGLLAACGGGSSPTTIDGPHIVTIDAAGGIDSTVMAACNVNLQTGCPTGDKCTWIRVQTTPSALGVIGCAPVGTVATGGACTFGASGMTTGFDNCALDNFCSSDATTEAASGTCTPICSLTGTDLPCPTGFSCSRFSDTFANDGDTASTGLCDSNCDPLTQESATGAAGCGGTFSTATPPVPTKQCVGGPAQTAGTQTQFSCADVLAPPNGNVTNLNGHVLLSTEKYINSCGPRALPLLDESTSDTTDIICVALCGPGPTFMGSSADLRGVAPNNLDRTDVSLGTIGSHDECRYWWFLENDGQGDQASTSSFSNGLGFDWAIQNYTFDASMLAAPNTGTTTQPVPSCASLTNDPTIAIYDPPVTGQTTPNLSDAEVWGCVPQSVAVPLNSPTHFRGHDPRPGVLKQLRAHVGMSTLRAAN